MLPSSSDYGIIISITISCYALLLHIIHNYYYYSLSLLLVLILIIIIIIITIIIIIIIIIVIIMTIIIIIITIISIIIIALRRWAFRGLGVGGLKRVLTAPGRMLAHPRLPARRHCTVAP